MFAFDAKLSTAVVSDHTQPPPKPANKPLSDETVARLQRYWHAANYLTVGQIYLQENPLLREPLSEHIKPRLLGHWGTSPGQNFIYVHLNRLIRETDANVIYISGPGHGGPAMNACAYLEGTYTEVHPEVTQDSPGCARSFRILHAWRRSEPLRPAHAELDARGRGTRLFAGARIRRGFR